MVATVTTTDLYASLGLSPNEAKIYDALIESGEASVGEISVAAKIHRRNTYDAINRLVEKGLCFEIISTTDHRYSAVDPDKLTELLSEKQEALQQALPALKKRFHARSAKEEAFIYRGMASMKNVWRDMLRVGKDTYIIGAKGQWWDPRLNTSREAFLREARRIGVKFHLLFDREVKEQMGRLGPDFPASADFRYLPKAYSTNSIIQIFGDYIVTYTGASIGKFSDDTVFFVIKSRDLAADYRKWFQYMWSVSSKTK